jgi:hypothetical protein
MNGRGLRGSLFTTDGAEDLGRPRTGAGGEAEQKRFLEVAGVSHSEEWTAGDIDASRVAWNAHVQNRRKNKVPNNPVAEILIGGFAVNRQDLVTRNPSDFRQWFPKLVIREP